MSADILNYGNGNLAALQVTTGLYPSTSVPLDIRERVRSASILTSNTAVGCKLYTGLRIYVEDTQEVVTVLGLVDGADGSKWNHWKFDRVIQQFKDAIDDCRNVSHQGRYNLVEPGVYTPQNLLNYLFLRCNDTIVLTHLLTINYEFSDGSMAAPSYVAQVAEGGAYNVSSPILSGYECSNEVISGTMGNTDVTVTVTYSAISYYLTYKLSDSETYIEYYIPYNTQVTVPEEPLAPTHYVFNGWTYTPSLLSGNRMPATNVIAMANWKYVTQQYTVSATVTPTGGGTVTGAGTYDEGSNVVLRATPSSNYRFINWVENGSTLGSNATLQINNLQANRDIIANFSATQVNISVGTMTTPSYEEGGTATGGGQMPIGALVTVSATLNDGYRFEGWYVGSNRKSTELNYTFTATENVSLTAKFMKVVTVQAYVDPNNYGTTSGQGQYDYGATVTLTASPAEGKNFVTWKVGGSEVSENPWIFTATNDVEVTAAFEDIRQLKVYAWTSDHPLTQAELENVNLSSITSYATVYETQDDESYYTVVPETTEVEDVESTTFLITAIPDEFVHPQPGQYSYYYVPADSDSISRWPDLNSAYVVHDGKTYLVVESDGFDTSHSGGSWPVIFGNVEETKWSEARLNSIEIDI